MAKFQPGNPGRPKGIKNRAPPMQSIRQSLAAQGFALGLELLKLLSDKDTDATTRLKILQTIAQYTQIVPRDESPQELDIDLLKLSDEELEKLANPQDDSTATDKSD